MIVSDEQWRDSAIYIHVSILFQTPTLLLATDFVHLSELVEPRAWFSLTPYNFQESLFVPGGLNRVERGF